MTIAASASAFQLVMFIRKNVAKAIVPVSSAPKRLLSKIFTIAISLPNPPALLPCPTVRFSLNFDRLGRTFLIFRSSAAVATGRALR